MPALTRRAPRWLRFRLAKASCCSTSVLGGELRPIESSVEAWRSRSMRSCSAVSAAFSLAI
jgi:hypothetical protein